MKAIKTYFLSGACVVHRCANARLGSRVGRTFYVTDTNIQYGLRRGPREHRSPNGTRPCKYDLPRLANELWGWGAFRAELGDQFVEDVRSEQPFHGGTSSSRTPTSCQRSFSFTPCRSRRTARRQKTVFGARSMACWQLLTSASVGRWHCPSSAVAAGDKCSRWV